MKLKSKIRLDSWHFYQLPSRNKKKFIKVFCPCNHALKKHKIVMFQNPKRQDLYLQVLSSITPTSITRSTSEGYPLFPLLYLLQDLPQQVLPPTTPGLTTRPTRAGSSLLQLLDSQQDLQHQVLPSHNS